MQYDKDRYWYRVHSVRMETAPVLESVVCEANFVRMLVCGAGNVEVVVEEEMQRRVCSRTHMVRTGTLSSFPLTFNGLWAPRTVRVHLASSTGSSAPRELHYAPRQNVAGQLRELLVQGIGWARLPS